MVALAQPSTVAAENIAVGQPADMSSVDDPGVTEADNCVDEDWGFN